MLPAKISSVSGSYSQSYTPLHLEDDEGRRVYRDEQGSV